MKRFIKRFREDQEFRIAIAEWGTIVALLGICICEIVQIVR